MSIVELASRVLAVASALLALIVTLAGLTTGSRRRRAEAYYRAAADDGRSPKREAILRSLQREAVGWSIADRAVGRSYLFVPILVYASATALQFFAGRFLAQDLVAGKRVWSGVLDLAAPETPAGSVTFSWLFAVTVHWEGRLVMRQAFTKLLMTRGLSQLAL